MNRPILSLLALLLCAGLITCPADAQGSVPVPDKLLWEKVDAQAVPFDRYDFRGVGFYGDTLLGFRGAVFDLDEWTVNDPLGSQSWVERGRFGGDDGRVITGAGETALYGLASGVLSRSYDGGQTYARVLLIGETFPLVTPTGDLLAWFEAVGYGICRTSNGQDWTCSDYVLDANGQPADGVFPRFFERARAGGPIPEMRLLANGRGGPAYSDDDGHTWLGSNLLVGVYAAGEALAVLDGGPLHGVAVSCNALPSGPPGWRIHQSTDGVNWTDVGPAPDWTVPGRDLVRLAAIPGGLLAAYIGDSYVWLSGDGGRTWRAVWDSDGPLESPDRVTDVEAGQDGRLYASVVSTTSAGSDERGGIYRTVDPLFVVASAPGPSSPSEVGLSVRPNPAGARVSVVVTVQERADAIVSVLDATGREVARLHDGPLTAGESSFSFDTSGLAAGVYVVRVVAGSRTQTARLVVTR